MQGYAKQYLAADSREDKKEVLNTIAVALTESRAQGPKGAGDIKTRVGVPAPTTGQSAEGPTVDPAVAEQLHQGGRVAPARPHSGRAGQGPL